MIEIEPIGTVHTPFGETTEAPNQGYKADAQGVISLDPAFEAGLADFEVGDTVLVLWWAEAADEGILEVERAHGKGVFKTRSPARPNRICITPCEITGIEGADVEVRGVDMTDGTAIIDLKEPLDYLGPWDEYRDLREAYERTQGTGSDG